MSIVSEALKKIQEERSATMADVCEKVNDNAPHIALSKGSSTREHKWHISRILIVMAIALSLIVAVSLLFTQKKHDTEKGPDDIKQELHRPEKSVIVPLSGAKDTNTKGVQLSLPKLSGIMYTSPNPQTIINGRVVQEGDTVNDYLVVKILPDRVNISRDNEDFELKL